jgi:hypothetical protein
VKFERYIWRISEAGQNFCSERAYVLQGIYVGDGCSQDDLDVVGYECLEYDEKTEHASSDDKRGRAWWLGGSSRAMGAGDML